MKFKAGNIVEVLRRNEKPHGSWFLAKILSADDDKYTVRYELFLTTEGEPVVEKVHKEDTRPCPPPIHGEGRWMLGDIIEVFDRHSWSLGKIMKVLRNNYMVVRVFDSIQLKEFHTSSLRVRQSWYNNRWVVIGKVAGKKLLDNDNTKSSYKHTAHLGCGANDAICEESCTGERIDQHHDATISPARTVKKNHAVAGTGEKRKVISKVGGCHQLTKRRAPNRKVDAVHSSKTMVPENHMHASTKHSVRRSADIDNTKEHAITEENNECSVASCSGNDLPENSIQNSRKYSREIPRSLFGDDATSSCPFKTGGEHPSVPEDKLAANIHELELHAYESTVQALYASGPLSWEQESLLTNLRLSLHISNEEHLLQLKNLLSA